MSWVDVLAASELEDDRKRVVRVDGTHVLLLRTAGRVIATPNRCPHEGYPLNEGECTADGKLRCHWHNWTFDLVSGETLVGADALPQFPVKSEDGRIYVDLAADRAAAQTRALESIRAALDDGDQSRLLREVVRLETAGGAVADAMRTAIGWLAPRLQYGTTHAIAGAADWLSLADASAATPDARLAAIGEVLGHIADDGARDRNVPFTTGSAEWDETAFIAAIDACDEHAALARINGALAANMTMADLAPALSRAALMHYADFGHSLIYVVKTHELIERLGADVQTPLLALLVRSMCYSTREDLLPEFRAYAPARERWSANVGAAGAAGIPSLAGMPLSVALETVAEWPAHHAPEAIFAALVDAALVMLLHADTAAFSTTRGSIANNATWLDFTHALTFAEAGARAARRSPELWPDVLLQIACFIGRSNGLRDDGVDAAAWRPADAAARLAELRAELVDHGCARFIISVHLIKTLFAVERLIADGSADPMLAATALTRYFHSPMKGRHVLRTARQMLAVAGAG